MIGKILTVLADPSDTVEDLKAAIRDSTGIPVDEQRIIFAGSQLVDGKTLSDCKIENQSYCDLILRLRGGGLPVLPTDLLDPKFNFDFRKTRDSGVYMRGGSPYIRPCGSIRFAFKVKGKFENDVWLEGSAHRPNGKSSVEDEWPVSYHGTTYPNGLSIAEKGFQLAKGKRFKHGKGVYTSPDPQVINPCLSTLYYFIQRELGDDTFGFLTGGTEVRFHDQVRRRYVQDDRPKPSQPKFLEEANGGRRRRVLDQRHRRRCPSLRILRLPYHLTRGVSRSTKRCKDQCREKEATCSMCST